MQSAVRLHAEELTTTRQHRYWVTHRGLDDPEWKPGWVEAADLLPGDRFLLADGSQAVLAATERRLPSVAATPSTMLRAADHGVTEDALFKGDTVTTYNLEVAETHTYHVGQLGVWVHNAGAEGCAPKFDRSARVLSDAKRAQRIRTFVERKYDVTISFKKKKELAALGLFAVDEIFLRRNSRWDTFSHELSHLLFERRVMRVFDEPQNHAPSFHRAAVALSELLASYAGYRRPPLVPRPNGILNSSYQQGFVRTWSKRVVEWHLLNQLDPNAGYYQSLLLERSNQVYGAKYMRNAMQPPTEMMDELMQELSDAFDQCHQ